MFQRTRLLLHRLTGSGHAAVGGAERRDWERFSSERVVTIHLSLGQKEPVKATIQDVSRGGICLLLDFPVEDGSMVRVDLPSAALGPRVTVLACVVHVQPTGDGRYAIGCNFSTELNDTDLEALGAKPQRSKVVDQRAWERLPGTGYVVCSRVNPPGMAQRADIHNVSRTGVALRVDEGLAPGTLLSLDLMDRAGRHVLTVVACVVYLSEAGDGRWLAGCNFVRALYDEDLQALIGRDS